MTIKANLHDSSFGLFLYLKLNPYRCLHFLISDHRSGVAPSDSERDCSSRRDSSDTTGTTGTGAQSSTASSSTATAATTFHSTNPFLTSTTGVQMTRLEVNPAGNESESGGSQPPSPRTHRRRQVTLNKKSIRNVKNIFPSGEE